MVFYPFGLVLGPRIDGIGFGLQHGLNDVVVLDFRHGHEGGKHGHADRDYVIEPTVSLSRLCESFSEIPSAGLPTDHLTSGWKRKAG